MMVNAIWLVTAAVSGFAVGFVLAYECAKRWES